MLHPPAIYAVVETPLMLREGSALSREAKDATGSESRPRRCGSPGVAAGSMCSRLFFQDPFLPTPSLFLPQAFLEPVVPLWPEMTSTRSWTTGVAGWLALGVGSALGWISRPASRSTGGMAGRAHARRARRGAPLGGASDGAALGTDTVARRGGRRARLRLQAIGRAFDLPPLAAGGPRDMRHPAP